MTLKVTQQTEQKLKEHPLPEKAIKTLANSIYKTLKSEGCQNKDIIGVSSQLIGLVTSSILEKSKES